MNACVFAHLVDFSFLEWPLGCRRYWPEARLLASSSWWTQCPRSCSTNQHLKRQEEAGAYISLLRVAKICWHCICAPTHTAKNCCWECEEISSFYRQCVEIYRCRKLYGRRLQQFVAILSILSIAMNSHIGCQPHNPILLGNKCSFQS